MRPSTELAIAEMGSDRDRLVKLAAINRRHIRRRNDEAIAQLRSDIIGDRVRRIRDEKIAAAHRDRAAGLELAKIDR